MGHTVERQGSDTGVSALVMATASSPARYRDVLAVREFRALFVAHLLSLLGDRVASVALSILVFDRTGSAVLAAASYAATYLPWLIGTPLLAGLADRRSRRSVMVGCDLVRAALVAVMAVPGVPLAVLFVLLFAVTVLAPPFDSARAATVPDVLDGDAYVVGLSLGVLANQFSFVIGFVAGGALVGLLTTHGSLAADAVSFLVSALLIGRRVKGRPAAAPTGRRAPAGAGVPTGGGLRVVFDHPLLRRLALLAWLVGSLAVLPEGLAVTFAHHTGHGNVATGLLTAAGPAGAFLGALVVGRLVPPRLRTRLLLPLAAATFVPLLVGPLQATLTVTMLLWLASGFGTACQLPANAAFVAVVPPSHRSRAFAVVQSGLMGGQGIGLLVGGALAEVWSVPVVVCAVSVLGLLGVGALARGWPSTQQPTASRPPPAPLVTGPLPGGPLAVGPLAVGSLASAERVPGPPPAGGGGRVPAAEPD